MPSNVRITDRDKGWKALLRRLRKTRTTRAVTVGIHGDAGGHDAGPSVIEIATYHEFGMGNNPERSFVAGWADENEDEAQQWIRRGGEAVMQGKSVGQVLEALGLRIVADMQKRMAEGIAPENADSTLAQKKGDKPLINTGQLRSSITHRVES